MASSPQQALVMVLAVVSVGLLALVGPVSFGLVGTPLVVSSPGVTHDSDGASAAADQLRPVPSSPAPSANTYNVSVFVSPSYCTIFIGLLTFGNDSDYRNAPAGFQQVGSNYCQGEAFVSWSTTNLSVNRSDANPATLDIETSGTLTANFEVGYNVTFNETGLVFGTIWTVTIDGNPVASTSVNPTLVIFQKPNGNYPYVIARVPYYSAKYAGTVNVDGRSVEVNVTFTSTVYDVEFLSSGLPSSTLWSVTLNYTPYSSRTPWITLSQPNGTWAYTVSWVAGYTANVTSGTVVVAGEATVVHIGFSPNGTGSAGSLSPAEKYAIVGGGAAAVVGAGAAVLLLRRRAR